MQRGQTPQYCIEKSVSAVSESLRSNRIERQAVKPKQWAWNIPPARLVERAQAFIPSGSAGIVVGLMALVITFSCRRAVRRSAGDIRPTFSVGNPSLRHCFVNERIGAGNALAVAPHFPEAVRCFDRLHSTRAALNRFGISTPSLKQHGSLPLASR